MQIKLKNHYQEKNSLDCGLVCLKMIMEYYGEKIEIEELKKTLKVDQTGSYMPQIGKFLENNGYQTEIISLNPGLFTLKDQEKSDQEIKLRIKSLLKNEENKQKQKVLSFFESYLEAGGKIKVKIPDIKDVKSSIKENKPMLALLHSHFLSSDKPDFYMHFNVITGFDEENIYVNDPLENDQGGKKIYKIKDFFYGLYASAYADFDNASLMKVCKI